MKESAKGFLHGTRQAVVVTLVLMLICGLIFPTLLTGLSALIFPHQAGGSLVEVEGQTLGAQNVGQEFTQDYYMWSRPSAYHYNVYTEDAQGNQYYTDGTEFAGLSSGSNNYAPSNPDLAARVEEDIANFLERNPDVKREDIPTDLLTASGSGLDPHISPASAEVQIPRIVKASGLSEDTVREIVARHTGGKVLGVFGEDTVNVLLVNIDIAQAMGLIGSGAE
ncbi:MULTISPECIES: K(+)-transporting ATPase subunit C [unclassified Clostridium]|uniref:K(+)-transporting ATPase subunit C n=1 Tax=unclassified Clostridium TaxID=2614128 RepID=UPI001105ACA8|nr:MULTISPECIES: K(+)-transporting ATPase subunit C [unclassified Clostridium]